MSKRWDDESWVLKRALEGHIVTQRMCGLSERLFVRCAWTPGFAIEEHLGVHMLESFLGIVKDSGNYGVQEWLF